MKSKTLLLLVMTLFIFAAYGQKKEKQVTGYAVTALEKGARNWKEVRLVDINTGQEVKSIYQSAAETEPLNARTGKPIVKKDISASGPDKTHVTVSGDGKTFTVTEKKRVVNLDEEL